jgi:hypothetical protein
MRYKRCVYFLLCSITLIWGCQSRTSSIEGTATETTPSSVQKPKAILVPLPDPVFIAATGRDSDGVIRISISDGILTGRNSTMMTFYFVDSDFEKNIPPGIYVGGRSKMDVAARMLARHESAVILEVLEKYLEAHYSRDQLRSLSEDPYLPIDSEMRTKPPHCLMHILHQHKAYSAKVDNRSERTC